MALKLKNDGKFRTPRGKLKNNRWQQFSDEVRVKQRNILWYLVFFGFSINYCIRINVNIAIVDMIDENFRKATNTSIESECFEKLQTNSNENSTNFAVKEERKRFPSLERKLLDALGVKKKKRKTHAIKQLIRIDFGLPSGNHWKTTSRLSFVGVWRQRNVKQTLMKCRKNLEDNW